MLLKHYRRGVNNEAINEINVVPYVDIMLVLLVIFMVVTPLAIQGLEINLPKTESKQLELEQSFPFVIDINDKGQYFIDCLLYTSPSPRDGTKSRMPSSA